MDYATTGYFFKKGEEEKKYEVAKPVLNHFFLRIQSIFTKIWSIPNPPALFLNIKFPKKSLFQFFFIRLRSVLINLPISPDKHYSAYRPSYTLDRFSYYIRLNYPIS